jgi:3-methyl-2-oxobutanoate hydroxymethyltransferase
VSSGSGTHGRKTIRTFHDMKARGERIAVMTAYDVMFSRLLSEAGVDMILVGDSLGQVVMGLPSTIPVTMDHMVHHASAVRRGAPDAFVVLDMPFLSYQVSPEEALRNAGRALQEAGVDAVKLEGASRPVLDAVARIVEAGIPVMGHVGFTPQSVHALGGYRVQGRGNEAADRLLHEARALEEAGCFSIVLELVPAPLAERVSGELRIPTIGIGAGPGCDGQVLVVYDALGLNAGFRPRFLKRFADLEGEARRGIEAYLGEVRAGTYPGADHSFEDDR